MNRELRQRFHQAVTADGTWCLPIDAGNDSGRMRKWTAEKAARCEGAYCVQPKPHLLPLDFDGTDGMVRALDCAAGLREIGLRPVVLASGGDGTAHVWVSVNAENIEDAERVAARFPNTKGKVKGKVSRYGQRMRPPLSPHREGGQMRLIEPQNTEDALAWLEPTGEVPKASLCKDRTGVPEAPPISEHPPVLSFPHELQRRELLARKVERGFRSEHVMSVAGFYVRHGFAEEHFINDVLDHPKGAGAKVYGDHRDVRGRRQYLHRTWVKALEGTDVRVEHEPGALAAIEQMRQESVGFEWRPRENTLVSLHAIIERAAMHGRTVLSISQRELAEWAGVGTMTAGRHLVRLIECGWLVRVASATVVSGTQYRLVNPTLRNGTQSDTPPSPPMGCVRMYHFIGCLDALWAKGSMKKTLLQIEGAEPMTTSELAERCGRSYESMRQSLKRLEAWGLVEQAEGGTWRVTLDENRLTEIAETRQTVGRVARLKAEHARQREGWIDHNVKLRVRNIRLFTARRMFTDDVVRPERRPSPDWEAFLSAPARWKQAAGVAA